MSRLGFLLVGLATSAALFGSAFLAFRFGCDGRGAYRPAISAVSPDGADEVLGVGPAFSPFFYPKTFYDNAFLGLEPGRQDRPLSVVVPHHLLRSRRIAETLWPMRDAGASTVLLLSPNHFNRGSATVQLTTGQWGTPTGLVQSDAAGARWIADGLPFAELDDATFEGEHGVYDLVPFLPKVFPGARVLPLVISEKLHPDEAQELAAVIAYRWPDAPLIASIDMSHELPEPVRVFHDSITRRRLAGGFGGFDRADLEIDANRVLEVFQMVNELRGNEAAALPEGFAGLSSVSMGVAADWHDNTSYIPAKFYDGPADSVPYLAMHLLPEISAESAAWRGWGNERLVMGPDEVVSLSAHDGVKVLSWKRDGLTLTLVSCGGAEDGGFADARGLIAERTAAGERVVFYGGLEPRSGWLEEARAAGALVAFGSRGVSGQLDARSDGVTLVGDEEVYPTVGLILSPGSLEVYPLPMSIESGRPELLGKSATEKILDAWSISGNTNDDEGRIKFESARPIKISL